MFNIAVDSEVESLETNYGFVRKKLTDGNLIPDAIELTLAEPGGATHRIYFSERAIVARKSLPDHPEPK